MIHSAGQVAQIVKSIQEFGWTNPLLIDEHNVIIAGHGRLLAAQELEFEVAPCIVLTGLTENQKKSYRIADNKIPLNASWDDEMLASELAALSAEDFELDTLGFSSEEIDKLLPDLDSDDGDEKEAANAGGRMEIPFEKDEARSGVGISYVQFDGNKIPLTQDEKEQLSKLLKAYVEENGTHFGFITWLVEGDHASS